MTFAGGAPFWPAIIQVQLEQKPHWGYAHQEGFYTLWSQNQNIRKPSPKYSLAHYLFALPQLQIELQHILFSILIQNKACFKTKLSSEGS